VVQTPVARTGTYDAAPAVASGFAALSQPQTVGAGSHAGMAGAPASTANTDFGSLNTPSVWRSTRGQAAAKVESLVNHGMDEIEIPAFLRKQAD
jgi:cell division protein FtsZ